MFKIIPTIPSDTCEFWNSLRTDRVYVTDEVLSFSLHPQANGGSLWIRDLTHAMKPGKQCAIGKIEWIGDAGFQQVQTFLAKSGYRMRPALEAILAMAFPETQWGIGPIQSGDMTFYRSSGVGVRTFSPWRKPKPLPESPAKWTIPHVLRALLNGQFDDLQCEGHYTDDYAYDAAVNFGKGRIENAAFFAARILESPSGWWCSSDRSGGNGSERVSICCHHFDSNSFRFRLNPPATAAPEKPPEKTIWNSDGTDGPVLICPPPSKAPEITDDGQQDDSDDPTSVFYRAGVLDKLPSASLVCPGVVQKREPGLMFVCPHCHCSNHVKAGGFHDCWSCKTPVETKLDPDARYGLAIIQQAFNHGHPCGIALVSDEPVMSEAERFIRSL